MKTNRNVLLLQSFLYLLFLESGVAMPLNIFEASREWENKIGNSQVRIEAVLKIVMKDQNRSESCKHSIKWENTVNVTSTSKFKRLECRIELVIERHSGESEKEIWKPFIYAIIVSKILRTIIKAYKVSKSSFRAGLVPWKKICNVRGETTEKVKVWNTHDKISSIV